MSKVVFVIMEKEYDEVEGYRICTVHEGFKGYYETNKFAGQDWDLAKEYVGELNAAQGVSVAEAHDIIRQAMEK